MKILLIGPMPDPITGVSVANEAFVAGCRRNGAKVEIINTHVQKDVSSNQGSEFSIVKVLSFLSIYKYIFRVAYSDILYLTPGQTFFGILKYAPFILLARLLSIPYVIHLHGNYLGKEYANLTGIKKRIFAYFISGAAAGIVLSESLRKNFKELLPPSCIFVVENFVSDDLLADTGNETPCSELKILFLSNLMKEKGVLDLLQALKILKEKGVQFEALFAGAIEKEIKIEVETMFKELHPAATYIGIIKGNTKSEVLKKCNTFVLPTYYIMEGQPISILEAMAFGHVVVTTRHAGIPDIAGEKNALFVNKSDPGDLAEKLEQIALNPRLADAVSLANKTLARERFTEVRFSDQLFRILKDLKK